MKTALAAGLAWIATAGVVAAITAVYTTNKTVEANRIQAERDYLRGERRVAYASFEACVSKVSDAITKAVTVSGEGPRPPRQVPYPAEIGTALHAGLDCLSDAEIQMKLLAPAATAAEATKVWNYYAFQVQGFDELQRALTETPRDESRLTLARGHFAPAGSLDHANSDRVDITSVTGHLLDLIRRDIGSNS